MFVILSSVLFILCIIFFLLMITISKENNKLVEKLTSLEKEHKAAFSNQRNQLQSEHNIRIKAELEQLKKIFDPEYGKIINQALLPQSFDRFMTVYEEYFTNRVKRSCQELQGAFGDIVSQGVSTLSVGFGDNYWSCFQQFKANETPDMWMFPRNTRLAYTKGNCSVLLLEEQPQVRTMLFSPGLLSESAQSKRNCLSTGYYALKLSFPFTYFLLTFDGRSLKRVYVYFRNTRLNALSENLHVAPLPNTFWENGREINDGRMCMGDNFWPSLKDMTMSKQAEYTIDHFWQSPFNTHLGEGVMSKHDIRLTSWAAWEKLTDDDPHFTNRINWQDGKTARWLVEQQLDMRDNRSETDKQEKLFQSMLASAVTKISSELKTASDSILKRIDKVQIPKDTVKAKYEEAIRFHGATLFENCSQKRLESSERPPHVI